MKCTRCHGSGVDPDGTWSKEERLAILRGILDFKLTQIEAIVLEGVRDVFKENDIPVRRQKAILAELGAEFPNVHRTVENIHVHLTMDKEGKLRKVKPAPNRGTSP